MGQLYCESQSTCVMGVRNQYTVSQYCFVIQKSLYRFSNASSHAKIHEHAHCVFCSDCIKKFNKRLYSSDLNYVNKIETYLLMRYKVPLHTTCDTYRITAILLIRSLSLFGDIPASTSIAVV